MKQIQKQLLPLLAAGCLLTACGADVQTYVEQSSSAPAEPAEQTSATVLLTSVTLPTSAEPPKRTDQTVSDTGLTAADTAPADTTAPQETAPAEDGVTVLHGSGTATASLGLNIRREPDHLSKKVGKIPENAGFTVEGFTEGTVPEYGTNRWLKVSYDGTEGFVSADYAVVNCSDAPGSLSQEQKLALGKLLYPQAMSLMLLYQRSGGWPELEYTAEFSGEYQKLKPNKTMQLLEKEFSQYFIPERFPTALSERYIEQDGALWVLTGFGDNVSVMDTAITEMTAANGNTLSYTAHTNYYPDYYEIMNAEFEEHPFSITYADGVWKCAELTVVW